MPFRFHPPVLLAFLVCIALGGCVTSPALRLTTSDLKPENIRILIAKQLLQTPEFGSISLIRAKIINARISAASEKHAFSGEPYIYYCVAAMIENPLYPIHQTAFGEVEIKESKGQQNIRVRARTYTPCEASAFEPFPEIEHLSLERYKETQ